MALTILQQPRVITLNQHPIVAVVESDNFAEDGFRIRVDIDNTDNNGVSP